MRVWLDPDQPPPAPIPPPLSPADLYPMGPLDALWHLLNLFGPALGLGLIAPTLAKALWRDALRRVPWRGLVAWVAGADAVVTLAGLALSGRDGRMATYAAMVLATAAVLGWRGFWRPAR